MKAAILILLLLVSPVLAQPASQAAFKRADAPAPGTIAHLNLKAAALDQAVDAVRRASSEPDPLKLRMGSAP